MNSRQKSILFNERNITTVKHRFKGTVDRESMNLVVAVTCFVFKDTRRKSVADNGIVASAAVYRATFRELIDVSSKIVQVHPADNSTDDPAYFFYRFFGEFFSNIFFEHFPCKILCQFSGYACPRCRICPTFIFQETFQTRKRCKSIN